MASRTCESEGGIDLGSQTARLEMAGGRVSSHLGKGDDGERPLGRRAVVEADVGDVGEHQQRASGELGRRKVFVNRGLRARQATVTTTHHWNTAAA